MNEFDEKLQYYVSLVDSMLPVLLNQADAPALLEESMSYSLMAGGKRLRPVLCFAVCELLGGTAGDAVKAACALEMIHTYSLIHDDLPSLDNDDFRRGKPTSHRVYGEANAILAGDGLLSLAFFLLGQTGNPKVVQAVSRGAMDMVSGQSMDVNGHNGPEELFDMYEKKTGALIKAAVLAGAWSSENPDTKKYTKDLCAFAEKFGLLFQMTDDILDVTGDPALIGKNVGQDAANGKITVVDIYGLEPAKEEAVIVAQAAEQALGELEGDTAFLRELVERTLMRLK